MSAHESSTPDARRIAAALANDDARAVYAEIVLAGRAEGEDLPQRKRERALQVLAAAGLVGPSGPGSPGASAAPSAAANTAEGTHFTATAAPFRALLAAQPARTVPTGPERFLRDGRIDRLPAPPGNRAAFFGWLADRVVNDGEVLTERALNERLAPLHDDFALLRRGLVDFGALERTPSGSEYRRAARARDDLLAAWRTEERVPRCGWTFEALRDRVTETEPEWDFDVMTRDALRGAEHMVDVGTGGGERLLSLAALLPSDTTATEGWPVNVPVAREALRPRGIDVVEYAAASDPPQPMPFSDERFDLVLDRHEAYDPREVARVLRPGGFFLTQQVGGDDLHELRALFGTDAAHPGALLDPAVRALTAVGLVVELAEEWRGALEFSDVGALVHYLGIVPWYAPSDFSVDRYAETLLDLERRHDGGEHLAFTKSRFVVTARKP